MPTQWLVAFTMVMVAGCATIERGADGNPRLERLPAEALQRATPVPVARITLDDLVRLSRENASVDQIMQRYRASNSRLNLNADQRAELAQRGVSEKLLDAIGAVDQAAARADRDDALVRREAAQAAERQRQRADAYYYGDGYGYPSYGPGYYSPFGGPRIGGYYGWPRSFGGLYFGF